MKTKLSLGYVKGLIPIAAMCVSLAACTHHTHAKHTPPGQAKKVTGSKSAKPFAPGQRKD